MLTKFLREHQREGVQFMFDCTMRLRGFEGAGCILADDMVGWLVAIRGSLLQCPYIAC